MKCAACLDQYLLLDKHEALPAGVKMHLLYCRSCRKTVSRISAAETVRRQILNIPAGNADGMLDATMNAIYRFNERNASVFIRHDEKSALLPWLAVGLVLIAGFIMLPFSDTGRLGLEQFGDSFCIPFALLCAGSIVAYAAVFIAKNIVFFTEKFEIRRQNLSSF